MLALVHQIFIHDPLICYFCKKNMTIFLLHQIIILQGYLDTGKMLCNISPRYVYITFLRISTCVWDKLKILKSEFSERLETLSTPAYKSRKDTRAPIGNPLTTRVIEWSFACVVRSTQFVTSTYMYFNQGLFD